MSLFLKKDLAKVIAEAHDPNLAEGGHAEGEKKAGEKKSKA